jgi:probable DNA repair protein
VTVPAALPAQPGPTTVTPTRRLAYALRREHERKQLEAGHTVWSTPDIVAFDDLVARILETGRQLGHSRLRRVTDSSARALWQSIIEADPGTAHLVFSGEVASLAARAWRRLHAWGDSDEPSAGLAVGSGESPETEAFARWARTYAQALEERGWIDTAQAPDRVDPAAAPPRIRLQGFDRLTPQQTRWVARMAGAGIEVEHKPPAPEPGPTRVLALPDAQVEFESAVRWAAARLAARPQERIAIVAPDLAGGLNRARRALDRVFDPAAGRSGGPDPGSLHYQLAVAEDLGAQPWIRAAFDLLGPWIDEPELAATSRWLRSPALAGAEEEAGPRAELDVRLRRQSVDFGVHALAAGLAGGLLGGQCPILHDRLVQARLQVRAWPEKDAASHWSERFMRLLGILGWHATSGDGRALLAVDQWRAALVACGAADEFDAPLTARRALGELRRLVADTPFQVQSPASALTVIEPGAATGLRFDALWVCGLDSTRWPGPSRPDPLLARAWQARVELPGSSAALAEREARERLESLRASAAEVILSWPRADGEAMLLPSPLLRDLPPLEGTWPQWPGDDDAQALCAARPVLERLLDPGLPAMTAGSLAKGGARLLELQAACAFRAQAELRLGAVPLEQVVQGIEPTERGTFVHSALAHLWAEIRSQARLLAMNAPTRVAAIDRAIDAALREVADSERGVYARLLAIEADWLRGRIAELLDADRARADFEVLHRERKEVLTLGPLTLELRLDRIDRLADGSLAVIDYKTGASTNPTGWTGERPTSPQLPAYALACKPLGTLGAVAFGKLHASMTGYEGFARDGALFHPLKVVAKVAESWEALLDDWKRRLAALAVEHAAGSARLAFVPAKACRHCQLQALCRIDEVDSRVADDVDAEAGHD